MSRRMAREAFSILLPRTESPTMRAACRTSFSTSSRRWMLLTTVPSWTSVSWAISAKGWGGGGEPVRQRTGWTSLWWKPKGGAAHQASGPAVNHLRQAELELAHELLGCLGDATVLLQLPDPLGHRQHLSYALDSQGKEKEV